MKSRALVYMVAVVVGEDLKPLGYKLLNVQQSKTVLISIDRMRELLASGYPVVNMRLSERGRIECIPKNCTYRRYTFVDELGIIRKQNIPYVLLSKYNGKFNREICVVYNNISSRIELFEYNEQYGTNMDHVANSINLEDELRNSVYETIKSYWDALSKRYDKFKYELNKNLNLSDLAIYIDNRNFEIKNCLWLEGMHHSKCGSLKIYGMTYGIGYQGIRNCEIDKVMTNVQILESESFYRCKIGELLITGDTWHTGTELIKQCNIRKVEIGQDVELNAALLFESNVDELILHGSRPNIRHNGRKLIENCGDLRYIFLDKNIDPQLYEDVCRLAGYKTKILFN